MQKGSLFTGRKTQFYDFSQKSCLFHTFFHIFAKIAYFALGVTVWNRRLPNIHTGGHLQSSKKTSIEQHVCIDKNNFLGVLLVVLWRGCLLFLLSGPPSLLCSDERDFQFWTQSCLEPFQKTKNETHSQSALFVASTSIRIIMISIPTINFGKLVNALNISQMWWRSQWLSLQFNQYLRQLTKTEYPQALSFSRNVFTHGRNEIFPTFISPIRDDFKFPGRIIGEGIKPLRCIRKRPLSFAHTMCCIDFFFFLILKLLHLFAAVTSQFQIRVKFCGRSNWTVKLFSPPFFFAAFVLMRFYGHFFFFWMFDLN